MTESWEARAREKREAVLALISKEWRIENPPVDKQVDVTGKYVQQFLTEREVEVTETTAEEIVKYTASGQWHAEEVTRAFCHRAALAHQLLHCLHEIFFDAAIADAKALDEYYAKHKKPIGPLHGLPVSLKDQFHVKGVETTMGYVGWIGTFEGKTGTGKEKVFESEMVRELRNSGAVMFCKTAVPHTLMTGETVNNIIGYTLNPKNRNLSCGGSSGGEGALIGIRGSPMGFGTDIGGSIRIPAGFNGLYGIRPSGGRMPYEGMANSMDGQNSVLSVVGPLATSIPSLRLAIKALLAQKPWLHDPLVHEIPWRDEQEREIHELTGGVASDTNKTGKLSFGVFRTDGLCNPQPPIRRAMDIMVEALQNLGHEMIEWKPPMYKALHDEGMKTWDFDGGTDVKADFALSGEPMSDQVKRFASLDKEYSASEIAGINVKLRRLKKEYMEYWNSSEQLTSTGRPVDAIISPLAPFPAARRNMYKYIGYSTWVNFLDYTSVVVPVTNVDKSVDKVDEGYQPIDETDKLVQESYDPEIYDGAHVSLQLVGRRLQEERMLAIAEYVAKAIGK
ncbi:amidase signature domain-containing protein [Massariosphaeria phaeospora]|uniref:amidase n=1 Tax=Massariosphaeria phaeospora TaxID=100035 RepID=A0A7C8M6Y4_9PLEO|nr:amidase signature domain-containing protein [Massariosphaeria phaeospora]